MGLLLRLAVFAGLGVDAYVHIKLAGDAGHTGTITASTLFWVQGVVAAVVAILVLIRPRPVPYLIGFLVAASALGAVLLYRYVDVGTLGPLPEMYEPVWYTDKVTAAVAEAVATVAAAIGFAYTAKRRGAVGSKHGSPINA
jgi:hypothetical protein